MACSSSSTSSLVGEWEELPPELTPSILGRLSTVDLLKAQMVCRSWRSISKDPSMWRKIESVNLAFHSEEMWRRAIDLSDDGLVEISIDLTHWGENILAYMADRSSRLRSLTLTSTDFFLREQFVEAVKSVKVVGQSCPNLKTLKQNCFQCLVFTDDDEIALAIAETMPGLRHLSGNGLSNTGLNATLDTCPHLEHLDLRNCFNIHLYGNLEKRCLERIKFLRRPNDDPSEIDPSEDLSEKRFDDVTSDEDDTLMMNV
ncbi:PREDICTED: putative F-box/LRR-repeat protein 23 [Camelina sativa]|uniref:F-box/LRR-repeat protein 23 n=1 Tax=Camelina sativa TaxID=90675 RepID=A0ABM1QLR0_CAMSA|nr:PREDICTED: putative F-box/LRR-repeat protein 23 [Camelina sativa]